MELAERIYEKTEYTVEDVLNLPEGQRAELIDGHWYDMATPSRVHQEIVMTIAGEIRNHIRSNGGKCHVYPAPFAVFLNKDNRNLLEPDVVVVCDEDKLSDRGCEGAPDLVVEVVSPATKRRDYGAKFFKYHDAGVKECWIINPETRITSIYGFSPDEEEGFGDQVSFEEELVSVLFPDFSIKLSDFV